MKNNLYCSETTPLIHKDLEEAFKRFYLYLSHVSVTYCVIVPLPLADPSLCPSATSSPVSICTPAQPPLSQILPPSPAPTVLQSLPSPSPGLASASGASAGKGGCRLTVSPSTLVVRYVSDWKGGFLKWNSLLPFKIKEKAEEEYSETV